MAVPIITGLVAFAVAWGATEAQLSTIETTIQDHIKDPAVHTNSELIEWRLQRIEENQQEILRRLPKIEIQTDDGSG